MTSGSIDYIHTGYWQAADGNHSLDLSGGDAGGIAQTFDTVPGRTYRVSFQLAGNPSAGTKTVRVLATGGVTEDYTFDASASSRPNNMRWESHTYTFTATSAATTLSFTSLTAGAQGPALDDVSVTDITPTPTQVPTLSQWALFGLAGLLGMTALRRRVRQG